MRNLLAYILDTVKENKPTEEFDNVKDFPEFPQWYSRTSTRLSSAISHKFGIGNRTNGKSIVLLEPTKLMESLTQLQELLDNGFVWPWTSPWRALILFVEKKDRSMKVCIDYCDLN